MTCDYNVQHGKRSRSGANHGVARLRSKATSVAWNDEQLSTRAVLDDRRNRPKAGGGHAANDSVMCPKVMSLFLLANVAFSSSTLSKIKDLHMNMERYQTSFGMLSGNSGQQSGN